MQLPRPGSSFIAKGHSQTAFSQKQNLYFVAYGSDIYVYVPQYPTQALPHAPALIVPSQPSRPGLRGTLDPRHPHYINAIVVERLGNEEVVAAVRDDGDVSVWLVRHVMHAVARRAEVGSSLSPVAEEVKATFQANVGQSAWGLAIHAEARLIAVSANTHRISLFRFGLARESRTNREVTSNVDAASSTCQDRTVDVTLEVFNGSSNIPHVAFCNTGDDPQGRWLLTTDIGGNCRAIDLDVMQTYQTFRFAPVSNYLESHDRFNAGWGIFFLDRRSFIPEDSMNAALGLEKGERLPGEQVPGLYGNPPFWDISATVSHVPRCAAKFSASRRCGRRSRERRSTSIASAGTSSQLAREAASSPDDAAVSASDNTMMEAENDDVDPEIHDDNSDDYDYSDYDSDDFRTYTVGFASDDESDDHVSGRSMYDNNPRVAYPQRSVCEGLPCPILHASVRSVYLLQPPSNQTPTVGFNNALQQLVPAEHGWLNAFERLNMHCYIPAIGIVVLASQKGRVMILSLSRFLKRTTLPSSSLSSLSPVTMEEGFAKKGHSMYQVRRQTVYAMRIEHILPFDEQEQQMHRPFQPLHGIATSPVQQGTALLPEDQCRWRLMLMYADHSILSYEISRKGSHDSAVDIGSVLV